MKVNGIIAEYNPFHNGHMYQLEESRRLTGADYTVVVMSGNFVQRGAPALVNKHLRAEMALRCGADLVLELPVLYAASSSEYFAAGAVALLDKLGAVTHLCFGSECGDAGQLRQIAAFLADEPEEYRDSLKELLKQGFSYPDARARALSGLADARASVCGKATARISCGRPRPRNCASILSSPNNILGIDYIKEITKRKSDMIPTTVMRTGAGYHDTMSAAESDLHSGFSAVEPSAHTSRTDAAAPACPAMPLASAYALRQALQDGQSPERLRPYMPEDAARLLESCLAGSRPLFADDFSDLLYYKLLTEQEKGYESYLDISADLSNRILGSLRGFTDFEAFCGLLKTKAFTHTRISRCLIHILLDIRKEDLILGRSVDYVPYARALGFRRSAEPLLKAIKANTDIPLLTKPAHWRKKLPPEAHRLFRQDILASDIYMGVAWAGSGRPAPNEFSTPLAIL